MTSNPPLVSVIIPVYNAARYLDEAIKSILEQTYRNLELIIVDDCSTDGSYKVALAYVAADPRVRVFKNKSNQGISGNRNRGIGLARGTYIAWQDADDISLPNRVERQVALMESRPEVGICGGYLQFFQDSKPGGVRRYAPDDATLRRHIFRFSPVAQPAAIIRRECFERVGLYNTELVAAEDLDMSFRIGVYYKFANLTEVVLRYREHPGSSTARTLRTMELNTIRIRRQYAALPAYKFTRADAGYNALQSLSIYLIPPKLKTWLFNALRNSN